MSSKVIGLTGGIGSGKTTVANGFAELGITLVDADLIAREVVEPGQPALNKIADHFGTDCLDDKQRLNRSHLRQLVFADNEARQWLENLLHPLIRQEIIQQLKMASSPYTLLVSPLLLETDQHSLVEQIIVVDVPESVQIERTRSRDNNSSEQVQAIIDAQIPRQQRLAKADFIIDNNVSLEQLQEQISQLDQQLRSSINQ